MNKSEKAKAGLGKGGKIWDEKGSQNYKSKVKILIINIITV